MYHITSYVKKVSGKNVKFLIIGNRLGWFWDNQGKRYGDFVEAPEGAIMEDVVKVLEAQARETVKQICKKVQTK